MFQMILIFVLHALNIHSRLAVHRSRHVITAPFFSFSFFFFSLFFPMLSRKFCLCLRFSTPRLVEINHVTSLWWNITRRHTHGHKHHGRGISGFRLGEIPDQGGFKVQVAATSRLLSANERFVHTQETTGLE